MTILILICQPSTVICQLSLPSKNPDFFLLFIGIKDCCAILVKTYGNLDSGSIEALTLAYPTAPALILPWVVGL